MKQSRSKRFSGRPDRNGPKTRKPVAGRKPAHKSASAQVQKPAPKPTPKSTPTARTEPSEPLRDNPLIPAKSRCTATVSKLLSTAGWEDYALLDSGEGRKLEQFGSAITDRPDEQAMWQKSNPNLWQRTTARFMGADAEDHDGDGRWALNPSQPKEFAMSYRGVTFESRFTAFRHMGVFPEQAAHWDWCDGKISEAASPPRILNLFGYTGVASLLAAKAGAQVTHVDASKKTIVWARENQDLSGMDPQAIRWICDDALEFVLREARRGKKYDGIIMDPPKFGRGPKGEIWQLFEKLPHLLAGCREILSAQPNFVVLTAYSIRTSSLAIHELMQDMMGDFGGHLE
jgi:23S rRNA (cytosine1962-C5)-methyltransferase